MRNRKTHLLYYILGAIIILIIGGTVMLEVPLKQEHVEITLK